VTIKGFPAVQEILRHSKVKAPIIQSFSKQVKPPLETVGASWSGSEKKIKSSQMRKSIIKHKSITIAARVIT
jgi:hypothetical protein